MLTGLQLRRYEQALTDDRPEAAAGGVQAAAHYQAPVPHSGATVLEDLRRSPERPPLPPKARRPALHLMTLLGLTCTLLQSIVQPRAPTAAAHGMLACHTA